MRVERENLIEGDETMVKCGMNGHKIIYQDDAWVYADTLEVTVGNPRDCYHCKRPDTEEGHDGCLGTLEGVMNACCGHNINEEAYIMFEDRSIIGGEAAINWITEYKESQTVSTK
jgi:hypothetical protein